MRRKHVIHVHGVPQREVEENKNCIVLGGYGSEPDKQYFNRFAYRLRYVIISFMILQDPINYDTVFYKTRLYSTSATPRPLYKIPTVYGNPSVLFL